MWAIQREAISEGRIVRQLNTDMEELVSNPCQGFRLRVSYCLTLSRNPKLITFLIVAAQVLVAAHWKKARIPSRIEWFNKVWYVILMHKLSTKVK